MKFILIILIGIVLTTRLKQSDYVEANRMPSLNLHIEDHDRDPINFKRFDGERKEYQNRLEELYRKYQSEKNRLMGVIAAQNDSIQHLSNEIMGFYSITQDLIK
jgi:hypothetical protein